MNEFVKKLYDFMGIYRIVWSQNSHYRYLTIFYRFLPIFYLYFSRNSSTSARAPQSRFFVGKIGIFRFFGEKSTILPIFQRKIGNFTYFSSVFSSRCRPKTDFSAIYRPKKPIFLSLGV